MILTNLNDLSEKLIPELRKFDNKDVVLSDSFKQEFADHVKVIEYSNFTTVIEKSDGLIVILPNQWFYIAQYFVDFYIALLEYKDIYKKVFGSKDKTLIKKLRDKEISISDEINKRIKDCLKSDQDVEYFSLFLTDYEWWHGQKTIDRGDFVASPILGVAGVVNDSHSYIVDLVKIYTREKALINKLKESSVSTSTKLSFQEINNKNFNIEEYNQALRNSGLIFDPLLTSRFVSSLCTKPFVLLSGLSGSGKTKLALSFAQWICETPEQYCLVKVGADWTNREPLLGYPNALNQEEYIKPENGALDLILNASRYPKKPFFLILDEMNLSHVERYFADFLSIMESKDSFTFHSEDKMVTDIPKNISLPQNLFIIGTVNIDETTYMFSPKVLDRASVIEFRLSRKQISEFLSNFTEVKLENLRSEGIHMANSFLEIATKELDINSKLVQELKFADEILLDFFAELKKIGAEFGYRTAGEIKRFMIKAHEINPNLKFINIVDYAILQKLLPKVHGSKRKLEKVLTTLASICVHDGVQVEKYFENAYELDFEKDKDLMFAWSLEKICRMYKSATENGFASYAEA